MLDSIMLTMKAHQLKLFNIAKALALTSEHEKAHIGAVIVCGKDVVSVGVNGNKSHPLQKQYNKYRFDDDRASHLLHAELDAIIRARPYIKNGNASIYIYRVLRNGEIGMSKPCAGCERALNDYRIHNIFYTTEQGYAHYEVLT
jgi:deoxycytidylate deaminase